jgi:hypothetical protein
MWLATRGSVFAGIGPSYRKGSGITMRITTEDLHLAYRVVAVLQDDESATYLDRLIFEAAAELLRIVYRARTLHDPLPGQTELPVS